MSRLEADGVPLDKPRIAGLREAGLIVESPHNLAVTQAGRCCLTGLQTRFWQTERRGGRGFKAV